MLWRKKQRGPDFLEHGVLLQKMEPLIGRHNQLSHIDLSSIAAVEPISFILITVKPLLSYMLQLHAENLANVVITKCDMYRLFLAF